MSSSKGLSEITEKIKRKIKKSHEMNLDEDLGFYRGNLDINDKYVGAYSGSNFYPNSSSNGFGVSVDKQQEIDSRQNGFYYQINQIMNNLNSFEQSIEKDFEELVKFVEEEIENEINKNYQYK
jgi:hypothetical protein